MFYHSFRATTDVKIISCFFCIKLRVHVIGDGNNEIRGGEAEKDAGGDEK